MLQAVPVEKIVNRPDARAVDPDAVQRLADSIAAVGLINPIRVRQSGDHYEVIAGVHRVEAHKHLGLVEITAEVVTDDDLHAELAMIDENLCRAELSPADRARQTARRKAIYLELHPETGHGKASPNKDEKISSFAVETAKATGVTERLVQLNAERGEKVIPEVIELIRGTKLDTGTYLDKLKKLTPNDQVDTAKRDLADLRRREREGARKIIRVADPPLDDEDAKERQVAALMSAWNKASAEARQEFLERIDTPVFDRSAA
jgi:ParB-like chromosome segregation protein Spo0J